MGKHAAADDSSVDPLIAEALTHRPTDAVGAHRVGAARPASGEGGLGWPGEAPVEAEDPGSAVGWPEPAPSAPSGQQSSESSRAEASAPAAAEPARPAPRRGWRRLLAFSA